MTQDFFNFKNLNELNLIGVYKSRNNIYPEDFEGEVLHVGMGICYLPLQHTDKVTHTTIVEVDPEIIEYNTDIIKDNWTIIEEDAYTYNTDKRYDIIVLDIWYHVIQTKDALPLIEKYSSFLKPNGKLYYLKSLIKD